MANAHLSPGLHEEWEGKSASEWVGTQTALGRNSRGALTITLFLQTQQNRVCQGPTLPSLQPTGGNEAQGPSFGGKTMDFNVGTRGKV